MANNDITYQQEIQTGLKFNLRANEFIWPGHRFCGWSTSSDSPTPQYRDTDLAEFTMSYTHLYAIWDETKVNVKFDPNGGQFSDSMGPKRYTIPYGGSLLNAIRLENPTRVQHDFIGWFNTDGDELLENFNIYVTHDMEFVAKWKTAGSAAPTRQNTEPSGDPPSDGNWVSPSQQENSYKVVNYSAKNIVTQFFCSSNSQMVHYNRYNPDLNDLCQLFMSRSASYTYTHPDFPGEFYYKVDVLPGANRQAGQKVIFIGTPTCPIWQMYGNFNFDGWVLCDDNNNVQHADVTFKNLYDDPTGKTSPEFKPFFINKRLLSSITDDSGCTYPGFKFYATYSKYE